MEDKHNEWKAGAFGSETYACSTPNGAPHSPASQASTHFISRDMQVLYLESA